MSSRTERCRSPTWAEAALRCGKISGGGDTMGFKVGICGTSGFGAAFAPLFKAHPLCDELVLCDLRADVLAKVAAEVGVVRTYPSFDELCKSDVDAIAIFTQRWLHGPMAIQALKAGKHVY